jgi:hypothetical protein
MSETTENDSSPQAVTSVNPSDFDVKKKQYMRPILKTSNSTEPKDNPYCG